MTVAVDDLKAHLNIEVSDTTQDTLLTSYIEAAEAYIERFTEIAPTATDYPKPLILAVKQLAAHYYANREATLVGVSGDNTPLGFWDLVTPYRTF